MAKRRRKKSKKNEGLFSKILVALVIFQVLLYTYLNMYLSYKVGMEISPTLTGCFFGFFGLEVGILGVIKSSKIKRSDNYDERANYSETDEP